MSNASRPSFGRRVYLALFAIMGPADVKPVGAAAAKNPSDPTVPSGYHLETITDAGGHRRRIAVPDQDDGGKPPQ
jgi:hypothetical protein